LILEYQINKQEEEEEIVVEEKKEEEIQKEEKVEIKQETKNKKDQKPKKKSAENTKKELLDWIKQQLQPYNLEVKNFTSSWQSGQCLLCLYFTIKDNKGLDEEDYKKDALTLNKEAIELAETNLGIPALITAEDITKFPDELAIVTYLSYFKATANKGNILL
jgi:hypothetical protein